MTPYYSSEWPLQEAVYNALNADDTLVALASIYDHVPANTAYPYIVIGDDTSIDFDTKTSTGEEVTLTLHIWSEEPGRKEAKILHGHLKRILHDTLLTVEDHVTVLLRREFSQTFLDPDNVTRHGVSRFRAIVQAI